jgi:hypothetical protein
MRKFINGSLAVAVAVAGALSGAPVLAESGTGGVKVPPMQFAESGTGGIKVPPLQFVA